MNMDFDSWIPSSSRARRGPPTCTYTGGEPLVRKKDIISLCKQTLRLHFLSFTTERSSTKPLPTICSALGNFIPALSVEGFEEATDARAEKAPTPAVVRAMELLRRKKLPFGVYSATPAKTPRSSAARNISTRWSTGARNSAGFSPTCRWAPTRLPSSWPRQARDYKYHQVRKFRAPIRCSPWTSGTTAKFVTAASPAGAIPSHQRQRDIEPCALMHYSDSNITRRPFWRPISPPFHGLS
jgi:hypothetical protein